LSRRKCRTIRLSAHEERLVTEAAGLTGCGVAPFIIDAAIARAREILDAHHILRLDDHAYGRLMEALNEPSAVSAGLVELARRAQPLRRIP